MDRRATKVPREAEISIRKTDPEDRMLCCSRLMADAAIGLRRLGLLFLAAGALSCSCSGRYAKIDAHCHLAPEAVPRAIELMDRYGISVAVNLSGGLPGRGLEEQLNAASRFPG